jgi:putative acyl-CoA dehydrogenase
MRNATAQALHHATHRTAFQRRLADQPLMENVLADLALDSEAATWLAFRAAAALDAAERDPAERALSRLLAPIAKYWVCKRAPVLAAEALECQGGNGFIEEHVAARHYRDAPLNGLWEGSGNVICLDVLRALTRSPEAGAALTAEIAKAQGMHPALDASLAEGWGAPTESGARRLTEALATALCASLLLRHAPPAVADAYCRTRLAPEHGAAFGTLPDGLDLATIIQRALPV